jgi:hypothetical protein
MLFISFLWICFGFASCVIRKFSLEDWGLAMIAIALGPILAVPLLIYDTRKPAQ